MVGLLLFLLYFDRFLHRMRPVAVAALLADQGRHAFEAWMEEAARPDTAFVARGSWSPAAAPTFVLRSARSDITPDLAPRSSPLRYRAVSFSSRAILGRVTDSLATDETRIDRWLCAVRLVKTRPLATRLCEGGHVLVNGSPAKPSQKVRAGDRVEALIADRRRIVEVMRPIESRVGAAVAATCYVDHSPPIVPEAGPAIMLVRGEGRPSKRLRREFERLRRPADA
jgi:ribosome-associated heat shock protein Hsp15